MKIAVLGATGGSGVEFVKEALSAEHEVVAVVRTPSKLKIQHDKLKVVEGNIFSEESLAGHFKGCDCVVSCLGFSRTSVVTGYTDSIKTIVAAMRAEKVRRLVAMTAYYSDISSSDSSGFLIRWILIPMLRTKLRNMREMEVYLNTDCSDIDFTVVRPPGLSRGASSGKEVKSEIDAYFLENNSRMPRADVAKFMVQCLPQTQFFKRAVAIGL